MITNGSIACIARAFKTILNITFPRTLKLQNNSETNLSLKFLF